MSAVDGFLAPIITEILLTGLARMKTEGRPAHLYLGSPWLSNFPLFPGVFAGSFPHLLPDIAPSQVACLTDVVNTWISLGGAVTVLVQNYGKGDWPKKNNPRSNQEELDLLARCLEVGAEVLFGKSFHSKFIVCPNVVVSGSANITYSGYYRNSEHLHVFGEKANSSGYLSERAACLNHVISATNLGRCLAPNKLTGQLTADDIGTMREFLGY